VSVTGLRASSFVFRECNSIGDPGEICTGTWAEKEYSQSFPFGISFKIGSVAHAYVNTTTE